MTQFSTPNRIVIVPEVVPGGALTDPAYDQRFTDIQDALNDIFNTLNIQQTEIDNFITNIGVGGIGDSWQVVGPKSPNGNQRTQSFGGTHAIMKTSDNQLVVTWWETGTPNYWYAKKARSPYTVWTNLEETDLQATQIQSLNSTTNNAFPKIVENPVNGTLECFYIHNNSGTTTIYITTLVPGTTDGSWIVGPTTNTGLSGSFDWMDVCYSSGQFAVTVRNSVNPTGLAVEADQILYCFSATSLGLLSTTEIIRVYDGGVFYLASNQMYCERKMIAMDSGYVLALWEYGYTGSPIGIGWALSDDGGLTWNLPVDTVYSGLMGRTVYGWDDDTGSSAYWSGNLLPTNGSGVPAATNTLQPSGLGGSVYAAWDANYIPGTTKVGLVYRNYGGGAYNPGFRYAEFDRTNNSGRGGFTNYADHCWLSPQAEVAAQAITTLTDGFARGMWIHRRNLVGVNNDHQQLRFCKTIDDDRTSQLSWEAERVLMNIFNGTPGGTTQIFELTFLENGATIEVNGVNCLPILFGRYDSTVAAGSPRMELCVKLLPVAQLDLPY